MTKNEHENDGAELIGTPQSKASQFVTRYITAAGAQQPTQEQLDQALRDARFEAEVAAEAFRVVEGLRTPSGGPAPSLIVDTARDRLEYARLVLTVVENAPHLLARTQ